MKKILLIPIVLFLLASCTLRKELGSYTVEKEVAKQPAPIVDTMYASSLYKVGIHVSKRYFSGLMFFKNMKDDKAVRIVFLSEFGLNLLDFEYKAGEFSLKNCQEYLNRPMVLNFLKQDLEILLHQENCSENLRQFKSKKSDLSALRGKEKTEKYYYFYNENRALFKLIKKKGIIRKSMITIEDYKDNEPKSFEVVHGNKLKISFDLLKREI